MDEEFVDLLRWEEMEREVKWSVGVNPFLSFFGRYGRRNLWSLVSGLWRVGVTTESRYTVRVSSFHILPTVQYQITFRLDSEIEFHTLMPDRVVVWSGEHDMWKGGVEYQRYRTTGQANNLLADGIFLLHVSILHFYLLPRRRSSKSRSRGMQAVLWEIERVVL